MDTDELQNQNPTVRDVADLPTRLGKPAGDEEGDMLLQDEYPSLIDELARQPDILADDPFAAFPAREEQSKTGNLEERSGWSELEASSGPPSPASSSDYYEPIDEQEIFDLISTISDPEHPLTLGSLSVVNLGDVHLRPLSGSSSSSSSSSSINGGGNNGKNDELTLCTVEITPTVTHCSLATVIGLGVRVRLEQSLPPRFRLDVRVKQGTHSTADQVNKQLADKERVAAALENAQLMGVIRRMLKTCR